MTNRAARARPVPTAAPTLRPRPPALHRCRRAPGYGGRRPIWRPHGRRRAAVPRPGRPSPVWRGGASWWRYGRTSLPVLPLRGRPGGPPGCAPIPSPLTPPVRPRPAAAPMTSPDGGPKPRERARHPSRLPRHQRGTGPAGVPFMPGPRRSGLGPAGAIQRPLVRRPWPRRREAGPGVRSGDDSTVASGAAPPRGGGPSSAGAPAAPADDRCPLAFETLEVLIEGERVAGRHVPWHPGALVLVDKVLDTGAVGPVADLLPPAQAFGPQQPPRLQSSSAPWPPEARWHLARGRVRPMR